MELGIYLTLQGTPKNALRHIGIYLKVVYRVVRHPYKKDPKRDPHQHTLHYQNPRGVHMMFKAWTLNRGGAPCITVDDINPALPIIRNIPQLWVIKVMQDLCHQPLVVTGTLEGTLTQTLF